MGKKLHTSFAYRVKSGIAGKRVAFACPECKVMLNQKIEFAGKQDSCPSCGAMFVVPGARELGKIQESQKLAEAEKTRIAVDREAKKQAASQSKNQAAAQKMNEAAELARQEQERAKEIAFSQTAVAETSGITLKPDDYEEMTPFPVLMGVSSFMFFVGCVALFLTAILFFSSIYLWFAKGGLGNGGSVMTVLSAAFAVFNYGMFSLILGELIKLALSVEKHVRVGSKK